MFVSKLTDTVDTLCVSGVINIHAYMYMYMYTPTYACT